MLGVLAHTVASDVKAGGSWNLCYVKLWLKINKQSNKQNPPDSGKTASLKSQKQACDGSIAAKPGDLTLIPVSHMVEGKKRQLLKPSDLPWQAHRKQMS